MTLTTPVQGLRFGVSAYQGEQQATPGQAIISEGGTQTVWGLFTEYLNRGWSVRSEWVQLDEPTISSDAAYLEIGYMLTEHWQVAGRWDWYEIGVDPLSIGLPEAYRTVGEHEDLAVALSYWVNPKMVFKLEVHTVEGNRFASPDDLILAFAEGNLDNKTTAIQFGVDFSF